MLSGHGGRNVHVARDVWRVMPMMKRLVVLCLLLCPLALSGCLLDTMLDGIVNQPPRAVIDADPREGAAPLTVTFDAAYSHDDDGAIVQYFWDFGDPTDGTAASAESCQHTYTYAGTYIAKLTVMDDEGELDSQQIAIVVTNPPPVANVTVSNLEPYTGDEITFDASTSYDANGDIVSYEWDFGDGVTASGATVTHSYAVSDYYVVTLTITDDDNQQTTVHKGCYVEAGGSSGGCSGGTCGDGEQPYAVIIGNWSCGAGMQVGETVRLDGSSSRAHVDSELDGYIAHYAWDFGDGDTATGAVATHVYSASGRYVITLTVTNEDGATSTAVGVLTIGNATCY